MRRCYALLLSLALMLSLVSCAGGAVRSGQEAEASGTAEASQENAQAEPALAEPAQEEENDSGEDARIQSESVPGTYRLIHMVTDEDEFGEDLLAQMSGAGILSCLKMKSDGTGEVELFGQTEQLRWDSASVYIENEPIPYTLSDGVLTMALGGASVSFEKVSEEVIDLSSEGVDLKAQAAKLSPALPGTYYLYSLVSGDEETSSETLQMMNALGLSCGLLLNRDRTGQFFLFGESTELTWTEETMNMGEGDVAYTLSDHVIVFTRGDTSMRFIKVSDEIEEIPEADFSALPTPDPADE